MLNEYNELFKHLREDAFDYCEALEIVRQDLQEARNGSSEDKANKLWAIKTVVQIHQEMVTLFELLQQKEFYKAWCKAEEVEISSNNLRRNYPSLFPIVKDLYECIVRLQRLYPYKLFCSYEMKIIKERCSVCNRIRSIRHDCGHRRGYVYNGIFCCNIVEKCELIGVSLVENPVHKYAVPFANDKDGEREDRYDYSLIEGLMQYWKKPFQHWAYEIKYIHKPLTAFPKLTDYDYCPCGSRKKYYECCKADPEGVKHRLYLFKVEKL